jgi:hypothetical protein
MIALGRQHAFAFEVHVVDQRVTSPRVARDAVELLLNLSARRAAAASISAMQRAFG